MALRRRIKSQEPDETHERQVSELTNLIDYLNEVVQTIEVRLDLAPHTDGGEATFQNRHI